MRKLATACPTVAELPVTKRVAAVPPEGQISRVVLHVPRSASPGLAVPVLVVAITQVKVEPQGSFIESVGLSAQGNAQITFQMGAINAVGHAIALLLYFSDPV